LNLSVEFVKDEVLELLAMNSFHVDFTLEFRGLQVH